jgi:Flp pilus assembly protein TadD
VLLKRARIDEALDHLKLATELDPLAPIIWWFYGAGLRSAGRYTEAIVATDRALFLRPNDTLVLWNKVTSLVALGRYDDAVELVRPLRNDGNAIVASKLLAYARAGLRSEAEELLAQPRMESRLVVGLLALGQKEKAIAMVTGQELNRYFAADYLWDPGYDPLRNDPRWLKRMKDGGLLEAHGRAQAWRAANPPEKPRVKQ